MNEYVNAAPERGPGGLPRRRFCLVALLWLPIRVAVTLAYALLLSLQAWIVYQILRVCRNKIT